MIPRPKIVLMPIEVPPNMATVPKSLPAVLPLCLLFQFFNCAWLTIGSGT